MLIYTLLAMKTSCIGMDCLPKTFNILNREKRKDKYHAVYKDGQKSSCAIDLPMSNSETNSVM